MGIDDFFKQVQQDELEDSIELAQEGKVALTPIEYARARGIRPQRVYAAYRNRKLVPITCTCGRKVVDVFEADEYFGFTKKANVEHAEEDDDD